MGDQHAAAGSEALAMSARPAAWPPLGLQLPLFCGLLLCDWTSGLDIILVLCVLWRDGFSSRALAPPLPASSPHFRDFRGEMMRKLPNFTRSGFLFTQATCH